MKNFKARRNGVIIRAAILALALGALIAAPLLSRARAQADSIRVVNNTSRNIIHVYLAEPDKENWSGDQLNETILPTGGSYTLNNVSCTGTQTRVIAEDQDGCLIYTLVSCSGEIVWTITDDNPRDCGDN